MFKKIYLMTFLLLGISMFGVTFNFFMERHQFLTVALKTQGRVLKHNIVRIRGKRYHPVLSFFDDKGKMHIIETERGFKKPRYQTHEKVPLLYDPGNPRRAIVNTFLDKWGHTMMSGFFALFATCVGIVVHRRYRGK